MNLLRKHHTTVFSAAWLLALMGYILAGAAIVPFHGDESTQIYMSRDYDYVVRQGDWSLVRYQQPPLNPTEQQLRLLNGVVHKYLVGFGRHVAGIDTTNEQWDWATLWEVNWSSGHAPDERLLMVGRWASGVLLAGGVILIFGIVHQIAGLPAALIASLVYALHPALLLNGRRAMQEGSMIFFALLTVYAGLWFVQRGGWRWMLALGAAAGLAVASKHTNAFTVAGVFLGIVSTQAAVFVRARLKRDQPPTFRQAAMLLIAGLLALGIFFALNPAWWGDPVARARIVLQERTALLDFQVLLFGGYANLAEQVAGFFRQTFSVPPQYFEVAEWAGYIGGQIAAYERSGLAGLPLGASWPGAVIVGLLAALGLAHLALSKSSPPQARGVVGGWALVVCLSAAALTPLEWQRYYLPVYPVIAVLVAVGSGALLKGLPRLFRRCNTRPSLNSAQHQQRIG